MYVNVQTNFCTFKVDLFIHPTRQTATYGVIFGHLINESSIFTLIYFDLQLMKTFT